ncbi:MAG: hypothetical protein ABEJ08_02210 [Halobacteriaceae archaeon]
MAAAAGPPAGPAGSAALAERGAVAVRDLLLALAPASLVAALVVWSSPLASWSAAAAVAALVVVLVAVGRLGGLHTRQATAK